MFRWLVVLAVATGCGSSNINFGFPPDFPDAGDAGSSSSPLTAPPVESNRALTDGGTCR